MSSNVTASALSHKFVMHFFNGGLFKNDDLTRCDSVKSLDKYSALSSIIYD